MNKNINEAKVIKINVSSVLDGNPSNVYDLNQQVSKMYSELFGILLQAQGDGKEILIVDKNGDKTKIEFVFSAQ